MNVRTFLSLAGAATLAGLTLGACDPGDDPIDPGVDGGLPPPDCDLWYLDRDGDRHGDLNDPGEESCSPLAGRVRTSDDCDDTDEFVHPDQHELCDRLDNNCDGTIETPAECAATQANGCTVIRRTSPVAGLYLMCPQTVGKSWSFARSACQNNGMDLVHINDHTENTFLALQAPTVGPGFLWTGGTDAEQEGVWRWIDDGVQFWQGDVNGTGTGVFEHWYEAAPFPTTTRDCMMMDPMNITHDFPWVDFECNNAFGYVCERI